MCVLSLLPVAALSLLMHQIAHTNTAQGLPLLASTLFALTRGMGCGTIAAARTDRNINQSPMHMHNARKCLVMREQKSRAQESAGSILGHRSSRVFSTTPSVAVCNGSLVTAEWPVAPGICFGRREGEVSRRCALLCVHAHGSLLVLGGCSPHQLSFSSGIPALLLSA